jgi:hypothetical protein
MGIASWTRSAAHSNSWNNKQLRNLFDFSKKKVKLSVSLIDGTISNLEMMNY